METSAAKPRLNFEAARAMARSHAQRFFTALLPSIRGQAAVLIVVLAYWLGGLVIAQVAGLPAASTIVTYLPTYMVMMPFMILCLLAARAIIIMAVDRPTRPLTQLGHEMRTSLLTPERLAHAVPMLAAMLVFGGTFTVVKAAIPVLAPFSWDQAFEQMDRWLHGGVAPWELLQPLLGWPVITHAINWAYNFWFYFMSLIWVWQAFRQSDNRLRLQFFLSLTLGWILLGNVVATWLSSAGPCYYGRIVGLPDPYAPLMSYLHDVDEIHKIWALGTQEMLWSNYQMRDVMVGSGISAMPSLHVAIATLFALVCWRVRRWLGIVMTIYAVIIMIGSVHLGWHYAVDGYLGAAGMIAIWWCVGWCLRRAAERRAAAVTAGAA